MADLKLSDSPNVDTGYVVQDDGKQNKVQLVASLPTDNIELPDGANVDSGYVTVDGKKHRVKLTAVLYGNGGGGSGDSYTKAEIDAKVMALQEEIDTNAGKTAELDADLQQLSARPAAIIREW